MSKALMVSGVCLIFASFLWFVPVAKKSIKNSVDVKVLQGKYTVQYHDTLWILQPANLK